MAQTTYTSNQAVTLQNRAAAYNRIGALVKQLDALNLNLISVTRDASNFVIVVLNNPLPASKRIQLDLTEV